MTQRTPCTPLRSIARSRPTRLCFLLAAAATLSAAANQAAETLPQMSLEELLNVKVTVATRTETSLLDAPSIVSVITAEDIRRMGARNLQDVMRTVPGFELGVRNFGYPEIGLRGIITNNTEKIRILLDGVAVNENLEGSGTIVFGDLALENVERIEIIRGPGSAMYGTNAFLGVISILTKEPPPSGSATTVTVARGSFDTTEGSVLTGWSGPQFRVSGFVHFLETDGARPAIGRDAMSFDPGVIGGSSLAGTSDGHADLSERKLMTQVKADFESFYFNGTFIDLRKGPYLGATWIVNRHSEAHPYQLQGTLGFLGRPSENWTLEPRIYALHYKADNLWNSYPEGTILDIGGTPANYTLGRYDRQGGTQDTLGAEIKSTWAASWQHKVLAGLSVEESKLRKVVNETNVPGSGPEQMVDAGPIMIKNPSRTLLSAYLQDQWNPTTTLGITAGARMDRYSDAGTALSPRLAFVWQPARELSLKLLYGEAFRAPTFTDLYLYAYNGNYRGNEENKPEKIQTTEFEIDYRFGDRVFWRVDLFRNRIEDLLAYQPIAGHLEYRNSKDVTIVKGLETEVKCTFSESLSGFANYSCQSGRNEATGEALVGMANWRANLGLNLSPSERINVNVSHNIVGSRQRSAGDPRPRVPGYRITDLALTFKPLASLDLTLSAHNLFNREQRFQDVFGPLPGDFPWEGRSLQCKLRWSF